MRIEALTFRLVEQYVFYQTSSEPNETTKTRDQIDFWRVGQKIEWTLIGPFLGCRAQELCLEHPHVAMVLNRL